MANFVKLLTFVQCGPKEENNDSFTAFKNKISSYRFLAAPNPPGKMTASATPLDSSEMGFIFPLEMRADSASTLRVSFSEGAP